MKRKKIGVDLDSVLASLTPHLLEFHNQNYGTNLKEEDCIDYRLSLLWGCSVDEVVKRLYEFYDSNYFNKVVPVKGSQRGIDYLASKYDLYVITSRPTWIEDKTVGWLKKYFTEKFLEIRLTNQVSIGEKKKSKAEVGAELGIDYLIDDHIDYVLDAYNNGISAIIRDRPWNRGRDLPEGILRFYDWEEIESYL